jgi:FkbH-like protein
MADGAVAHFKDRQQLLLKLKNAGILLVALSKNSPELIRWNEMALQPSDFVQLKISWDLKVRSIQESAKDLNLGLDSFVVIDDNPAELELVRSQLPQVTVLDSTDPETWRGLERMLAFPNTRETEESRMRTELYRVQAQRRQAVDEKLDYAAMMASLDLRVQFGRATSRDLGRIAELVQRTNQFNTTTIRYSRAELEQLLKDPERAVYVAEMSDKFGSLGVVAVVVVRIAAGDAILDLFVMSCRAMSFGLEEVVLASVLSAHGDSDRVLGPYVPTDRNGPASMLYANAGFTALNSTDWVLEASAPRPSVPPWFQLSHRR